MSIPITIAELLEILRLHALWLQDDASGKRADLSRANLSRANLRWADLSGADLSRADLSGADLSGADLSRADLSRANLRWADLSGADLSGADLSGADLSGADLSRANLYGADVILVGQDIRGYLFWATKNEDEVVTIYAGCRAFTGIAAAREHWTSRHTHDPILHEDCLSLVDRCARMARVCGWKLEPEAVAQPEAL